MHEMSLTEGILQILEDQAKTQAFKRVKAVWLEIGELSHVEPDAMSFCFEAVMQGTIADGATLEIVRTPGAAWCMTCSKTIAVKTRHDECPDCGGYQLTVTDGDDMRVRELEVED